jgi:hypothetical protein
LFIDKLNSFLIEIDWHQFTCDDFWVLQEHVQEKFYLSLTTQQKVSFQLAEPFFLWELGNTRIVLK